MDAPSDKPSQNATDLIKPISLPLYFAIPTPQSCISLPVMTESERLKQIFTAASTRAIKSRSLCFLNRNRVTSCHLFEDAKVGNRFTLIRKMFYTIV